MDNGTSLSFNLHGKRLAGEPLIILPITKKLVGGLGFRQEDEVAFDTNVKLIFNGEALPSMMLELGVFRFRQDYHQSVHLFLPNGTAGSQYWLLPNLVPRGSTFELTFFHDGWLFVGLNNADGDLKWLMTASKGFQETAETFSYTHKLKTKYFLSGSNVTFKASDDWDCRHTVFAFKPNITTTTTTTSTVSSTTTTTGTGTSTVSPATTTTGTSTVSSMLASPETPETRPVVPPRRRPPRPPLEVTISFHGEDCEC